MSQSIHIEIDRLEGTLLRVLGLIERRGFHIDEIDLYDLGPDTRGLSVSVRPRDAGRNIDILGLQIDRLYGIKRLEQAPERAQTVRPNAEKLSA
ncbi:MULTISPECIES: ACT domain-containing protein [Asticcacaulis]|jgi:acetolactate synthase-1/3 small subunit|uniref:ACT domain-containing protein n=1 Tax=Asticcacaulis currens TaxID=2984210 RepID=A0ABT5ICZ6_9CAUL|nr:MULTISPECIES: ACT domain-containing protein [Asticcacaulis]MCA1934920.1 ACT domain-containing protein [Asticcacaulis sp.]MDC7694034.1 ACT domain-containing protein [Asticcacaulis currens]BEV10019.1 ACT domain-containing protein [Asticcacaulis sp. DW145]